MKNLTSMVHEPHVLVDRYTFFTITFFIYVRSGIKSYSLLCKSINRNPAYVISFFGV